MNDEDPDAKLHSLTAHRTMLLDDVLARYRTLKEKGVAEEEARNIASANAALYGKTKPNARAAVYRRLLDDSFRPRRTERATAPPRFRSWRLPE